MGILYIIATPIGNLKDITLRALEILKSVDLVLAEDTRVTKKILSHYEIIKPVRRYDGYAKDDFYKEIKEELKNGKKIALVTDAGTPGISDPGSHLVSFVIRNLSSVKAVPIPGASALITALSVSGINSDKFTFLGYPPHKKGRQTFFKKILEIETKPLVFYESPHRIEKTFDSLEEIFGSEKEIIVARELTKIYEEIFRGAINEAKKRFQGEKKKGEFVLIIP